MKRIKRMSYGTAVRITPQKPGALAQCAFCQWGRWFEERKRMRYSALARASASLRAHALKEHKDKFLKISTGEEILAGI